MNQQPDQLFRSKLESYQLPAPPRAWTRIEAGLDKSSGKFWLKIAAGFAVFAVAASLIWNFSTQTDIAQQNTNVDSTPAEHSGNPQVLPRQVGAVSEKTEPSIATSRKKLPAKERNKIVENALLTISEQPVEQVVPENAETEIEETVPATTSGVFIVYSAEEVNEKYLMKKPDDEATPEAKKASRFQKLAGVAYNITTGESGLGDLREKKNEILALNFLDDKKGKKN